MYERAINFMNVECSPGQRIMDRISGRRGEIIVSKYFGHSFQATRYSHGESARRSQLSAKLFLFSELSVVHRSGESSTNCVTFYDSSTRLGVIP